MRCPALVNWDDTIPVKGRTCSHCSVQPCYDFEKLSPREFKVHWPRQQSSSEMSSGSVSWLIRPKMKSEEQLVLLVGLIYHPKLRGHSTWRMRPHHRGSLRGPQEETCNQDGACPLMGLPSSALLLPLSTCHTEA